MTAKALRPATALHPVHALLLGGSFPLFLGAALSDWAYSSTFEIQWKNFASWLLVGALLFAGFALLWALIDLLRDRASRRRLIYFLLLLTAWSLGFYNALLHARDAWASMPAALVFAWLSLLFAAAATWLGFAGLRSGAGQ